MENEEIRGLVNKKASEDQFTEFCQLSFGALIILSLSLRFLDNQSFLRALLEECIIIGIWSKKVKEEKESTRGHWDQQLQQVFLVGTEFHI